MYRIMTNELKGREQEQERQAELIKSLTDQIVELQTALLEYQEAAWIVEELELAAGERHVLLEKRDGEIWLSVRCQLYVGPTLREAAMQAFEKSSL